MAQGKCHFMDEGMLLRYVLRIFCPIPLENGESLSEHWALM